MGRVYVGKNCKDSRMRNGLCWGAEGKGVQTSEDVGRQINKVGHTMCWFTPYISCK